MSYCKVRLLFYSSIYSLRRTLYLMKITRSIINHLIPVWPTKLYLTSIQWKHLLLSWSYGRWKTSASTRTWKLSGAYLRKIKWNIHTCWLIIYCITVSFEEESKTDYVMTIRLRMPHRTDNPPVEATT
jgi:hypothetical protein